jgi:hypothetical protein
LVKWFGIKVSQRGQFTKRIKWYRGSCQYLRE